MMIKNLSDVMSALTKDEKTEMYLDWPLDNFIIAEKYKLLYMPIAKNACSTFKTIFKNLISASISVQDIHEYFAMLGGVKFTLAGMDVKKALNLLADKNHKKMIIIRDPIERAVSGYLQKFVSTRLYTDEPLPEVKDIIDWCADKRGQLPDYCKSVSFNEFLMYLSSQNDQDLDSHWRPQTNYMAGLNFDYVFCLNSLDNAFDFLENISGKTIERVALNRLERSNTGGVYLGDAYPLQILSKPLLGYTNYEHSLAELSEIKKQYVDNYDLFVMPQTCDFLNANTIRILNNRYDQDVALYQSSHK